MPNQELVPFIYPHNLHNRVQLIPEFPDRPILADGMDESTYVNAVFGDVDPDELYIKEVNRPFEGIGPHFDIHNNLVSKEYPFVVTYNIRGMATLRATALSDALDEYYKSRYPVATNNAKIARRHVGALALLDPSSTVYEGRIASRTGLIIPQVAGETPLIHDIVPSVRMRPRPVARQLMHPGTSTSAGKFNKYIVPRQTKKALKVIQSEGYKTLSEYQRVKNEERERREEEARVQKQIKERNASIRRDFSRSRRMPGGGLLD